MNKYFDKTLEQKMVIAIICYKNKFNWYQCPQEYLILDTNKYNQALIDSNYTQPNFDKNFRDGIISLDSDNVEQYLQFMNNFIISKDTLSLSLINRMTKETTWWDVEDLFPIALINFDEKKISAFYSEGIKIEKYIPNGWKGCFIDFCNEYDDNEFPSENKFWVKNDSDLLALYSK